MKKQVIARNGNRCFLFALSLFGLLTLNVPTLQAQNYPPSCVVTMPYNNAYYKAGSDIVIHVYSTDIGKTTNNGHVKQVEIYNGDKLLKKINKHANHTYSFVWEKVPAGTYTLKAKATNDKGVSFTSVGVIITVGAKEVTPMGMSAGKGKYVANIYQRNDGLNYDQYWNGVTSENACKWETTEATRDQFNWQGADQAYTYATSRNMVFRYHAGVWASQYPRWFTSLTTEEAKEEIVEYLTAIAARFPLADQIDLLNEQLYDHQRDNKKFRELLGGPGTTADDYRWQIWLFEQGRRIFPNTKLVLNDYGLEGDPKAIRDQLKLFKVLRDRGIVDGFGTQAHAFNVDKPSGDTIKAHLDLMATSGLPIFVTELDMNGGTRGNQVSDSLQLISFKKAIPVFYEHPSVAGITLWGYIQGTTWMTGTGIMSAAGVENPSLVWMKQYFASRPNVGYPMGEGKK
jgi:GH35 family endo-1,4-beta-xylanase